MRVKKLEIQGFKSFKDKTVIHFDHNITGIVGPNGCGKSNIVDAFFWVMGEQSYKHMRGTGSEDLIFNGSSKYSPLGIAEATLTMETGAVDLENGPAGASVQDLPVQLKTKEISVTRRLYRSGEGEYFINGTHARLKDIQELFMDTGVGAKGYSVIEQGQIGKIVNAKPEERRLLVEEAAGIAKYKARKKESLRKMEATQANLSRLNDILLEIEKSLGTLEKQADKAKLYKRYKDDLYSKEITWGRRKNRLLILKNDVVLRSREIFEQDLVGLKAELQANENRIEASQAGLVTDTKLAEEIQQRIQEMNQDLAHAKSSLELSKKRQGDLTNQLQSLTHEDSELASSLERDDEKLQDIETRLEEASMLFERLSGELKDREFDLTESRKEMDAARTRLNGLQKDLFKGVSDQSHLSSRLAGIASKLEMSRAQESRYSADLGAVASKIEEAAAENEVNRGKLFELGEKREELRERKKMLSVQLNTAEEKHRSAEKRKHQAHKSVTELRSKLTSLQELDQSHEGLADASKAALDFAETHQNGHAMSALIDLLRIEGGYENLVEYFLEQRLEHLYSSDPEACLQIVKHLIDGNLGRVAIELCHLKGGGSGASSFESVRAFLEKEKCQPVGEFKNFVHVEKGFESFGSAVDRVFENVCLVEDSTAFAHLLSLETSAESSGKAGPLSGWTLVARDGVVLEAGRQGQRALRGGGLKNSKTAAIFRRKKSIEDLLVKVETADTDFARAEEECLAFQAEMEECKEQLQQTSSGLHDVEIQVTSLERDVQLSDRSMREFHRQVDQLQGSLSSLKSASETAEQEREEIEGQLEHFSNQKESLEIEIATAETCLQEKEEAFRELESEMQRVRVQEASTRERKISLKREGDALRSIIEDRKRRRSEIERVLKRASEEKDQFSGGESELLTRVESLMVATSEQRQELAAIKDRIESQSAGVQEKLDRVKAIHKAVEAKSQESNSAALEMERIAGELAHLRLNLEEKYGVGCLAEQVNEGVEGADPSVQSVASEEISQEEESELNREVERLRERIRRLGEVNVMAIEEFEQQKSRFDHLGSEKADLERSLVNLQEAINHINKTSEDRFAKAFDAIAERFEKLFPVIFGGGQAKLSLVYPEGSADILDAGVDILAQPPGKKVSNIGLLSGGEKALTAVSLIFAIFMVKPSPFCVLDEVDAPLDDANIGRFNALLREMSCKSQFILITHNKKTMELNDTLYGVTMEEPGVSKMVSIELRA